MRKDPIAWITALILILLVIAEQTAWGNSTTNTRANLGIAAFFAYVFLSVYLLVKAISRRKQLKTTRNLLISLLLSVPAFILLWLLLIMLAFSAG